MIENFMLWQLHHEMKQINSTRVQRYSFYLNNMQSVKQSQHNYENTIFTDFYKYLSLVYYT